MMAPDATARRLPCVRAVFAAAGFTLVELLVVITILGILIALLLPAVQAAREAARMAQCKNHLKQMALACLQHEQIHGFLPTGGWGWGWAGEPDRGFNRRQPSGWHYNILPYLEQENLHRLGAGGNREEGKRRVETPLAVFYCPSRRRAVAYPYVHSSPYYNIDRPSVIGRSDYAASSGDIYGSTYEKGPSTLAEGDAWSEDTWNQQPGTADDATGVIFRRSEVPMADVRDGASNTYLIGERLLTPDRYYDGIECANDQGWDLGYDFDVNRWTYFDCNDPSGAASQEHQPRQDTPGYSGCMKAFGSAHFVGFQMAFCDGSVHLVSYSVDRETHRRLGNRKDRLPIDATQIP